MSRRSGEPRRVAERVRADDWHQSVATLQNWAQGRRTPDGPALAQLHVAAKNPKAVVEALHGKKRGVAWSRAAIDTGERFRIHQTVLRSDASSAYELLEFDHSFWTAWLAAGRCWAEQGRNTASTTVSNRVAALKKNRSSNSLRPRYATIFNQCVVLLVSYFGSAVHSLFQRDRAPRLKPCPVRVRSIANDSRRTHCNSVGRPCCRATDGRTCVPRQTEAGS